MGLLSKVTGALGLTADPSAGAGSRAEAEALYKRMVDELDKLQIPDIEKQKLALQLPELVGMQQAQEIEHSALEGVTPDAQAVEQQRSALQKLQEMADSGLTEADRAAARELSRGVGAQEQARQASILAEMQQRGAGGAGQELAARLASSQGAAARQAASADRLAQSQAEARKQAIAQLGQQAGAFRGQQFAEQSSAAKARDAIAQFNAMQRAQAQQQNLARQQALQSERVGIQNVQQQRNKALIQQQFQNQMAKATGMQSALGTQAQAAQQRAGAEAQAAQAEAAGTRDILIGGTKMAMGMADGGVKRYEDGGVANREMDPTQQAQSELIAKAIEAYEKQKQAEAAVVGPQMPDEPAREPASQPEADSKLLQAIAALRELTGPQAGEQPSEDIVLPQTHEEKDMMGPSDVPRFIDAYADGGVECDSKLDKVRAMLHKYANGGREPSEVAYADGTRFDEAIDAGVLGVNPDAQDELLEVLRGNLAPEDQQEGRVIEGDSFSGDQLPDRINSGESVNTVKMQDRNKEMLREGGEAQAELNGLRKLLQLVGK